jgi:glutamate synthase domain-containing protein 3
MTTAAHAAPQASRVSFAALSHAARRAVSAVASGAIALRRQSKGIRAFILQTAGLAGMTAGAWVEWGIGAGMAVAGVACFFLNFLLSDTPPDGRR